MVLQRLVKLVKEADRMAYDLLTCLTFVEAGKQVDKTFIASYLQEKTGEQVTHLLLTNAVHTLVRYSFIKFAEQAGKPAAYIMHNLTQALMQSLLASQTEEATEIALRIYQKAWKDLRDQTEQAEQADDWISHYLNDTHLQSDPSVTPEPPSLRSASGYYRLFKRTRFFEDLAIKMQMLPKNIDDIQSYLEQNPDKRIGTITVSCSGLDEPLTIIDFDAENRPADGDTAEVLGRRFTLMSAFNRKSPRSMQLKGTTEASWTHIIDDVLDGGGVRSRILINAIAEEDDGIN